MENEEPKKTVTLTKGQLGLGGCIVAAIMVLNPVKEWFFTREEGQAQTQEIRHLRQDLADTKDDLSRRLERSADKIIEQIKETETRTVKNDERLERRIELLEANARPKGKTSNN